MLLNVGTALPHYIPSPIEIFYGATDVAPFWGY